MNGFTVYESHDSILIRINLYLGFKDSMKLIDDKDVKSRLSFYNESLYNGYISHISHIYIARAMLHIVFVSFMSINSTHYLFLTYMYVLLSYFA